MICTRGTFLAGTLPEPLAAAVRSIEAAPWLLTHKTISSRWRRRRHRRWRTPAGVSTGGRPRCVVRHGTDATGARRGLDEHRCAHCVFGQCAHAMTTRTLLRVVRQQGMCLLPQKLREDWSETSAVAWHRSGGGVGVVKKGHAFPPRGSWQAGAGNRRGGRRKLHEFWLCGHRGRSCLLAGATCRSSVIGSELQGGPSRYEIRLHLTRPLQAEVGQGAGARSLL